nr:non-specific lipid-transfer protein 2-like [Tanacetum cinerariifolium]
MRSATNITVCTLAILVMVLATPKVAFSATCSVTSLSPCLPAFSSGSPPTASCCSNLKKQQPCLCGYIKNPSLKQYVTSPNAKKVASTCGTEKTVPVTKGSSETTIEGDNDIYSTVNACPNACKMWKAIEKLKQGESINVQDLETNLYWEFGKFTSRDGESLESYYSRSQQATTRNRGKATVKSLLPIYDQEPTMVDEDDEMSKKKEIDKLMVVGARS